MEGGKTRARALPICNSKKSRSALRVSAFISRNWMLTSTYPASWKVFSARNDGGREDSGKSSADLQLEEIEISPSGFGIHFPKLDVDIYLPGLLEGFLGSKRWMAARLGQELCRSATRRNRDQPFGFRHSFPETGC